ncbi:MAG: hypothetical protein WC788_09505 [Candidatus Paceibacterota bacterium]|jgi:hypothetical protein
MKWFGISGSWRKTNREIEEKVRLIVREIMTRGDGIVSGGALGVDSIALDEALKVDPGAQRIRIYLPTMLKAYAAHYQRHAVLGSITGKQAENLVSQLEALKKINPDALIEDPDEDFNEETKKRKYYKRNSAVVDVSDELVAFLARTKESEGGGTRDTIEKARAKGIPVRLFEYGLND